MEGEIKSRQREGSKQREDVQWEAAPSLPLCPVLGAPSCPASQPRQHVMLFSMGDICKMQKEQRKLILQPAHALLKAGCRDIC